MSDSVVATISQNNTTTVPLLANQIFIGLADVTVGYSTISITLTADTDATITVQQSLNRQSNWDVVSDPYVYTANMVNNVFTQDIVLPFFRVLLLNTTLVDMTYNRFTTTLFTALKGGGESTVTVVQPTAANLNATVVGSVAVTGNTTVVQPTAANLNAVVSQPTAANLNAVVSQPTAANLNATVVGSVAVTGDATVVQPTAANFNATVVQPTATNLNATVVQPTAANLNATVVGSVAITGDTTVVQPTASNLNATVVQPTASNLNATVSVNGNATVVQPTAANLNATVTVSGSATVVQSTASNLNATVTQTTASNLKALVTRSIDTRTGVNIFATGIIGVASEALITCTRSRGLGSTSTFDSFDVTVGKTLRLTSLTISTRGSTSATAQSTTFNIRWAGGGSLFYNSTPILLSARSATPAVANSWDRVTIPINIEIEGTGSGVFGISQVSTFTNAPTLDLVLTGFEY